MLIVLTVGLGLSWWMQRQRSNQAERIHDQIMSLCAAVESGDVRNRHRRLIDSSVRESVLRILRSELPRNATADEAPRDVTVIVSTDVDESTGATHRAEVFVDDRCIARLHVVWMNTQRGTMITGYAKPAHSTSRPPPRIDATRTGKAVNA